VKLTFRPYHSTSPKIKQPFIHYHNSVTGYDVLLLSWLLYVCVTTGQNAYFEGAKCPVQGRLFAGTSLQSSVFDSMPDPIEFALERVALEEGFLAILRFLLSV
jgi:hypothetical protein